MLEYMKDNRANFTNVDTSSGEVTAIFGDKDFIIETEHLAMVRDALNINANYKATKLANGWHAVIGPACSNYAVNVIPLASKLNIMSVSRAMVTRDRADLIKNFAHFPFFAHVMHPCTGSPCCIHGRDTFYTNM